MNNQWRKRTTIKIVCPSGNELIARRVGPDLGLKSGKIARLFPKDYLKKTLDEQLEFVEKLPDRDLQSVMEFARVVIADVVVDPPLSLHPKEGQLSPDDVPLSDFWYIYGWAMNGSPEIPVKTKEGETTVAAVDNFLDGREPNAPVSGHSEQIQ